MKISENKVTRIIAYAFLRVSMYKCACAFLRMRLSMHAGKGSKIVLFFSFKKTSNHLLYFLNSLIPFFDYSFMILFHFLLPV